MKCISKRFSTKIKKELIRIDYKDLCNPNKDLTNIIHDSFGTEGLGCLVVKNIPGYLESRNKIMDYSAKICALKDPIEYMKQYEKPNIKRQIGWSYGLSNPEKKKIGDILQGAFNNRVLNDTKINNPRDPNTEEEFRNVWPNEEKDPIFKGYKENFLNMGRHMYSLPLAAIHHLDKYLHHLDSKFNPHYLKNLMSSFDSQSTLMAYFPFNSLPEHIKEENRKNIDWISWHRDFSCLTSLARAKHFTPDGKEYKTNGALLIKDRYGVEHECEYDDDEVALQIGDALYILSAGNLIATPHAVKTQQVPDDVMRAQYVSFFDPRPEQIIKPGNGETINDVYNKDPTRGLHSMEEEYKAGLQYQDFIVKGVGNFFQ